MKIYDILNKEILSMAPRHVFTVDGVAETINENRESVRQYLYEIEQEGRIKSFKKGKQHFYRKTASDLLSQFNSMRLI